MTGYTCCVPGCYNNNKREKNLGYYRFPKDVKERKVWLKNIGRKGKGGKFSEFVPTASHRVCSEHFFGGKKTYDVRTPTIFPLKPLKVSTPKRRVVKRFKREVNHEEDTISDIEPLGNSTDTFSVLEHSYSLIDAGKEEYAEIIKSKDSIIETLLDKIASLESELEKEKKERCTEASRSKQLIRENLSLKRKYHMAIVKQEQTRTELASKTLSMQSIKHMPDVFKFYTGFKSYEEYLVLYNYLEPDFKHLQYWGSKRKNSEQQRKVNNRVLSTHDEMLLVLSRLRVGLLVEDLAFRFGINKTTVSRICITYFDLLYQRLRQVPIWPSREIVLKYMPECFRQSYPTTRVIIDCTELFIETPSHFQIQSETYSSYKSHNTAKGLVGIAPNGFISLVSDLVPGRMSDKEITIDSGLVELLDKHDSVMADRGFTIDEYLAKNQVKLNIPPFMGGKSRLSTEEEDETRRIASVRIHVERAIERIKIFRILNYVFPNSMGTELNKIWVICCYLVNFTTDPIVSDN